MNNYIWKQAKVVNKDNKSVQQTSVKMVDMNKDQLIAAYNHCKDMLYNDSKAYPGRYHVLEEIKKQIKYCNIELAVRWFLQITDSDNKIIYTRFRLLSEINSFIDLNKDSGIDIKTLTLDNVYNGIPADFAKITINDFLLACKDVLGKFNRSHITQTFIINLGIWFTPEEQRNFETVERLTSIEDKLSVVKERLNIKPEIKIPIKATGLNYNQFRSMINLRSNKKYTELTTNQLETLRDKVLFILQEKVEYHIKQWETIMSQLVEVAQSKNITLD